MRNGNEIYCNMCGRKIEQGQNIPAEDFVSVKKNWGYFSNNDGMVHEFELCEECYFALIRQFQIPVTETEQKEML